MQETNRLANKMDEEETHNTPLDEEKNYCNTEENISD